MENQQQGRTLRQVNRVLKNRNIGNENFNEPNGKYNEMDEKEAKLLKCCVQMMKGNTVHDHLLNNHYI